MKFPTLTLVVCAAALLSFRAQAAALASTACTPLRTCSATVTTACATPTPTIMWTQGTHPRLAGYRVYALDTTGAYSLLASLPCEWWDNSYPPDGIVDLRFCRGAELDVPAQRLCPECVAFQSYTFAVTAITDDGIESARSAPVAICFSPVWIKPMVWN